MSLGTAIKKLRKEKGWTQAQLGEAAGVDVRNLSRYETDTVRPRRGMLRKLAQALGAEVEDLAAAVHGPDDEPIQDLELYRQFKAIEQLNEADKAALKRVISAVLIKNQIHGLTG